MKINAKAYRSFNNAEPVEIQELDGKTVEIYFMNESPYLSQYVPRGRFYFWTSDGKNYRLIVERGFYQRVSYFFAEDVNTIWVNFLEDLSKTYGKNNRIYFAIAFGVLALALGLAVWLLPDNYIFGVFIGLMVLSLVANAFYSRKITKIVEEKNLKAQEDIRALLTDEGFEKLLDEQQQYMKDYFKTFDDEPETNEEDVEELDMLASEVESGDEIEVPKVEEAEIVEESKEVKDDIKDAK